MDLTNEYCSTAQLYIENYTYEFNHFELTNIKINGWYLPMANIGFWVQPGTYTVLLLNLDDVKDVGITGVENLFIDVSVNKYWEGEYENFYGIRASYIPGQYTYVEELNMELHQIYSSDEFELGWFDYYETDDYLIFRMYAVNHTEEELSISLENPIVNGSSRHEGFTATIPDNCHTIYELYVPFVNHIGFTSFDSLQSLEYQLLLQTFPYGEEILYEPVSFPRTKSR